MLYAITCLGNIKNHCSEASSFIVDVVSTAHAMPCSVPPQPRSPQSGHPHNQVLEGAIAGRERNFYIAYEYSRQEGRDPTPLKDTSILTSSAIFLVLVGKCRRAGW